MMQVIGDQKTLKCSVFDWPGLPIWGWKFLKDTEEVSVSIVHKNTDSQQWWDQHLTTSPIEVSFEKKLAVLNFLCGRLIRVFLTGPKSSILEPRDWSHAMRICTKRFCASQSKRCTAKTTSQTKKAKTQPAELGGWTNHLWKNMRKSKWVQNLPQFAGWKLRTYLKSPTSKRMGCKTWS